jgi:septal ring factor EnvC (AmiA/AmiB activator)
MLALKKLLDEFKRTRSSLQTELSKSEVQIGTLKTKIKAIEQQLDKQQQRLAELQGERRQLKLAQKQQQKYIEQQILAAYQIGHENKLKILLNQQDPEKLSRSLNYYDYFNRARSEQIEQYVNIITELNNIEPRITKTTESLSNSRQSLLLEHNKLLDSKTKRKQNLAKINAAIKNKDQQLRKTAKDRAELEQLLATMKQSIANISTPTDYLPFKTLRGKLPWPVAGKPSNNFGGRRSGSDVRWKGLSIPAREGVEVTAIHHGRVIFADWLRGSGLLVILDHGDGYMSLYAHNQSLLRETGEWVNTGEAIATVGNSGGQQSANLYFEIRHNGQPTDPRKWCKRS